MKRDLLSKALRRMQLDPEVVERLSTAKAGDLQSVLLDVMRTRSLGKTPRDVLAAARRRFCAPGRVDPRCMLRVDAALFDAVGEGVELLELGPVAPLGCCSAVAPCDPLKIIPTVRNLEVTSDPSNVLALEAARRRSEGAAAVHLGASHRAIRAQAFDNPDFHAHFRLFVLVSMFPTRGSGRAELEALRRHLDVYARLGDALGVGGLERVSFSISGQPAGAVRDGIGEHLEACGIDHDDEDPRLDDNAYYRGLCFTGHFRTPANRVLPMVDGGFTDWGAQLASNRKERTLVSAIGSELLARDLAS